MNNDRHDEAKHCINDERLPLDMYVHKRCQHGHSKIEEPIGSCGKSKCSCAYIYFCMLPISEKTRRGAWFTLWIEFRRVYPACRAPGQCITSNKHVHHDEKSDRSWVINLANRFIHLGGIRSWSIQNMHWCNVIGKPCDRCNHRHNGQAHTTRNTADNQCRTSAPSINLHTHY